MNKKDYSKTIDELILCATEVISSAEAVKTRGEKAVAALKAARAMNSDKGSEEDPAAKGNQVSARKHEYVRQTLDTLSDREVDNILLTADSLSEWASDVKKYALEQAMNGKEYEHFKVVSGRSVRRYVSDEEVARVIAAAGYDPYERKLLSIPEMTKLLGKTKFEELLGKLVCKPQGKPSLVLRSDVRPAVNATAENNESKGE